MVWEECTRHTLQSNSAKTEKDNPGKITANEKEKRREEIKNDEWLETKWGKLIEESEKKVEKNKIWGVTHQETRDGNFQ